MIFCFFSGEQEYRSSTQDILIVVIALLLQILVVVCFRHLCRYARDRRRRQRPRRSNTPIRDRSISPPRDRRIEDVLAMDVFVRENSAGPPILSRHGTPDANALLFPPPVDRDGDVQAVYDDQVLIINRLPRDERGDDELHQDHQQDQQQLDQEEQHQQLDQEEQHQQLDQEGQHQHLDQEEQQQQQGSLMNYALNSNVSHVFEDSDIELISFNTLASNSTLNPCTDACISMV